MFPTLRQGQGAEDGGGEGEMRGVGDDVGRKRGFKGEMRGGEGKK